MTLHRHFRFVFVVPKVESCTPQLSVAHPTPWKQHAVERSMKRLCDHLSHQLLPYHSVMQLTQVQFPEARLIEYDCGMLQIAVSQIQSLRKMNIGL